MVKVPKTVGIGPYRLTFVRSKFVRFLRLDKRGEMELGTSGLEVRVIVLRRVSKYKLEGIVPVIALLIIMHGKIRK